IPVGPEAADDVSVRAQRNRVENQGEDREPAGIKHPPGRHPRGTRHRDVAPRKRCRRRGAWAAASLGGAVVVSSVADWSRNGKPSNTAAAMPSAMYING